MCLQPESSGLWFAVPEEASSHEALIRPSRYGGVSLRTCAHAGDSRTLKSQCDKLIVKAEVLTAHHKWWAERPDPNAPVLNIRTHANFAKDFLFSLGAAFYLTKR